MTRAELMRHARSCIAIVLRGIWDTPGIAPKDNRGPSVLAFKLLAIDKGTPTIRGVPGPLSRSARPRESVPVLSGLVLCVLPRHDLRRTHATSPKKKPRC